MSKIPTHKVVFIQDHYQIKDPKTGLLYTPNTSTLYIRSYQPNNQEKQHRKVSLKIKLKNTDIKAYFDERKQRFKDIKKFPEGQDYNEKIEDTLKKLGVYEDLSSIPDKRKSFLKYWQSIIDTTTGHGTRIKHAGVKTKLEKYLKGKDLLFSEITPELLRTIYHHFKTIKDPKQLTIGTANHYMKIIHGVINTAAKSRHYNYNIDPFVSIVYNKAEEPELEGKVLDGAGLGSLLNVDPIRFDKAPIMIKVRQKPPLPDELNKYRLSLLFQLFANGMRVSDMLLLRWNNFDGYVLRYSMFKTNKSMKMPINTNLINILCRVILLHDPNSELLNYYKRFRNSDHRITVILEENEKAQLNLGQIEGQLSRINDKHISYHALESGRKYLLAELEKWMAKEIGIWYNKENKGNEFVFPYLKNEDFKNIDHSNNFNKISEEQYKKIKHNTIVYNRNLHKIGEFYGLEVNLTSHVARHSFASHLLAMGDVNTFDIQQMLGHKNIQITDKYLQKHFNPKKQDDTNRRLSNNLRIK